MMGLICQHCQAKIFNPAKFQPLWQALESKDNAGFVSDKVQVTMTVSELEDGVKLGCSFCPLFSSIVQKVVPIKDGTRYRQVPYTGHTACNVWLGLERLAGMMVAHSLHIETQRSATFTGGSKDFVVHAAPGAG